MGLYMIPYNTKVSLLSHNFPIFISDSPHITMHIKKSSHHLFHLTSANHQALSESSQTVIVVTALVKEDEKEGQGHTSASLLHQSAM
jgi:hypothetical protein